MPSPRTLAFVYVLFRHTGEPFYVGIGTNISRPADHVRFAKRGQRGHKFSIIRRSLSEIGEVPTVIVRTGLSLAEAKATEIALIRAVGRHPNGPLVNLTDGGDSPKDVHPLLGTVRSEDTKRKIIEKLTGRKNGPHSEVTRQKIAQALLGKRYGAHAEKHKAAIGAGNAAAWERWDRSKPRGMSGRKHSAETILKMRRAASGRKVPAETIAKSASARTGTKQSEETVRKRVVALKARWAISPKAKPSSDEETRRKQRVRARERRAKIRESGAGPWLIP